MILKVTEQNGITIVEFVDVTRFTLASADEVKTELRPLLNNLKSASNLNGNLNCSKELEHYAS